MLEAKALTPYPLQAFTGRELVGYEWRPVPAGADAEAARLVEAGMIEIREVAAQASLSPDLSDLTVAELQELAKERGVSYGGLRKADLIEALS